MRMEPNEATQDAPKNLKVANNCALYGYNAGIFLVLTKLGNELILICVRGGVSLVFL